VDEQVGVNAPGREKTTTVLPLKTSSVVTFFQSVAVRVRNVTCGTFCPWRSAGIFVLLRKFGFRRDKV
jgi:hypothetical protein